MLDCCHVVGDVNTPQRQIRLRATANDSARNSGSAREDRWPWLELCRRGLSQSNPPSLPTEFLNHLTEPVHARTQPLQFASHTRARTHTHSHTRTHTLLHTPHARPHTQICWGLGEPGENSYAQARLFLEGNRKPSALFGQGGAVASDIPWEGVPRPAYSVKKGSDAVMCLGCGRLAMDLKVHYA